MIAAALLAFGVSAAATASTASREPVFACRAGRYDIRVGLDGSGLVYRSRSTGNPTLIVRGTADNGRVYYYRTLFARAENQTLRFVRGEYSYVVYSYWSAPGGGAGETYYGGVIVLHNDRQRGHYRCRSGGDMREWPIFRTLPADTIDRTPDR